ncbi:MAG: TraB/GumN family protein, partial [Pseudomonadota bacterium]
EAGLPAARLRQLSPSGATILLRNALDETPSDPLGQGVDAQLAALAQARRLPVVGLETHEEALGSVFRIADWMDRWVSPDNVVAGALLQIVLVDRAGLTRVRRPGKVGSVAYQSEDIGFLAESFDLPDTPVPEFERELQEITHDYIITERNYRFVDRIISRAPSGPIMVAVGAAHLAGDDGMLELLAAEGYRATRIPLN